MNRIPKRAQRAIIAADRARQARLAADPQSPKEMTAPTRLDISSMPGAYCRMFDVFFNGQLQTLCKIADSKDGYIVRYVRGRFNAAANAWDPLPPYETEQLSGQVTIRHKRDRKVDDMRKGGPQYDPTHPLYNRS